MPDFLTTFLGEDKVEDNKALVLYKEPKIVAKDDALIVKLRQRNGSMEEIKVTRFKKSIDSLLNKSVILYGPSGTGKTTIIKDFLYILQKVFPIAWGLLPTNSEKHDFDNILKQPLIYETFTHKDIENLYLRQKAAAEMYRNANDLTILGGLFAKVADSRERDYLNKLAALRNKTLDIIHKEKMPESAKREKIADIEDIFKDKTVKFYKKVINYKISCLQKMTLTKEEQYALEFRFFNPRTCIVCDDALTEILKILATGKKNNSQALKDFFYKGRHAHITHIYGFQDDVKLDSDIRKGAFHNIFTNKNVAIAYFGRPCNGFSPEERRRAEAVINAVFSEEGMAMHRKLVYSRLDKNPFHYIIADEHKDSEIRMCSKAVRAYCDAIKNNEKFNVNNPFHKHFASVASE